MTCIRSLSPPAWNVDAISPTRSIRSIRRVHRSFDRAAAPALILRNVFSSGDRSPDSAAAPIIPPSTNYPNAAMKLNRFAVSTVAAAALLSAPETPAQPPFSGTIFIDPDIITAQDATAFVSVSDAGQGSRVMFDRRVNN